MLVVFGVQLVSLLPFSLARFLVGMVKDLEAGNLVDKESVVIRVQVLYLCSVFSYVSSPEQ